MKGGARVRCAQTTGLDEQRQLDAPAARLPLFDAAEAAVAPDELLSSVWQAHGGLENWSQAATLTVKLELGGRFWGAWGAGRLCPADRDI
jgi:hypothetical protein